MNIKFATVADIKLLQSLNNEVFMDNSKYDSDLKTDWAQSSAGYEYFNTLVTDKDSICLIATHQEQGIGYLVASAKPIPYRLSKYLEIENMGVVPEYRSQGIGKKLINQCLNIAKSRGYQKVYVNAYFQNKGAISFYKNNGFAEIDLSLEKTL
jgi:ribosomal protein S18 acetylase RimI-like enzyme